MDFSQVKKAGKSLWYRFKGECVFCKIVESRDAQVVYEDESVMAFAPLKQGVLSEGHLLVIPKDHYESIFDIPKEELVEVVETVKDISVQLEKEECYDGGKSSQCKRESSAAVNKPFPFSSCS
ncbi:MAG: HIT domain-containing protein [Candidatus Nanohalobium sp.]